jgi:HicB family
MDVTSYVSSLRDDLMAVAAAGDEHTQRAAALLAGAIEPAARLVVLNALADMAEEVTRALGGERVVEVRLDGREVRVAVGEPDRANATAPRPGSTPLPDSGDISRITLRLVEQIKNRAEQAASAQGMSLNAWISQAVQGALRGARDDPNRDRRDEWNTERGDQGGQIRGWVRG